jgi:hypothetical protein
MPAQAIAQAGGPNASTLRATPLSRLSLLVAIREARVPDQR